MLIFLKEKVCSIKFCCCCCCFTAPAKPKKPTVLRTETDEVNVMYNFDSGGGYTYEFRVMYRKKCELLSPISYLFSSLSV